MVLNNVSFCNLLFLISITFSDLHMNKLDNCVWFIHFNCWCRIPLYEYTIIYLSVFLLMGFVSGF